MKPLTEIKQGCGKSDVYDKKLIEDLVCGHNRPNNELCPSCQALLTQTEEIIKEIDNWKENYNLNHDNFAGEQIEEEDYQELRQKIIGKDLQERKCPVCKTFVIRKEGLWYCKNCKMFFQESYIKRLNKK